MKNIRTCIACREKKDKSELIRIVKNKAGEVVVADSGYADGRGAYVCNNEKCIKKAISSKALNRSFKSNIETKIYDLLGEKVCDK